MQSEYLSHYPVLSFVLKRLNIFILIYQWSHKKSIFMVRLTGGFFD